MPRFGRKRLTVDVTENMHRELKGLAKFMNITMTKLIVRLIKKRLIEQEKYQ
jgi:hypothetical protein